MVKFRVDESLPKQEMIRQAMDLGKKAADMISSQFQKPIKLEFEKVYCPYLLVTKKRYAGLLYTKPDRPDKLDKKGIESVRRDNCLLIRTML
jgi:DNA polymerase delta subunit 1